MGEYSEGYYACQECHTLVSKMDFDDNLYQVKDEDEDLYGSRYWKQDMLERAQVSSMEDMIELHFKERAPYWLHYFLKYRLPPATIADVGGGLGQFSYLLQLSGFSQTMFEMSPEVCEYAKKQLGINTRCEDFTQNRNEIFDCVVAFDLIEHIWEVANFVSVLSAKTPPKGIMCIQTPCYDETLTYEDMLDKKPRFESLLLPEEHIYLFSRSSIARLMKQQGFNYIAFEPAIFGDDYDMFLFSSKTPMKINSQSEISETMANNPNVHLLNSLAHIYQDVEALRRQREIIEQASKERLQLIETLSEQVEMVEQASKERLQLIETLSEQLNASQQENLANRRKLERKHVQIDGLWNSLLRISQLLELNAEILDVTQQKAENLSRDVETLTLEAENRLRDVQTLTSLAKYNQRRIERKQAQINSLLDVLDISSKILEENHAVVQEYNLVKRQFWFRVLRKLRLIKV